MVSVGIEVTCCLDAILVRGRERPARLEALAQGPPARKPVHKPRATSRRFGSAQLSFWPNTTRRTSCKCQRSSRNWPEFLKLTPCLSFQLNSTSSPTKKSHHTQKNPLLLRNLPRPLSWHLPPSPSVDSAATWASPTVCAPLACLRELVLTSHKSAEPGPPQGNKKGLQLYSQLRSLFVSNLVHLEPR